MCPPANITNTGSVLLIRSRLVSGESSGRRIIGKTRDRSACRTRFCPYSCRTVYKSITLIFRVIKPCPFTRKKSVAKKNRLMDISRCLFPTERTLRSAARHAAGARVQFTWNVAESNDRRMIRIIFYYWLFLFFFRCGSKFRFPRAPPWRRTKIFSLHGSTNLSSNSSFLRAYVECVRAFVPVSGRSRNL